MALYAIGDIQGCLEPLKRLLDKVSFDPARDQVWFTGDLVNRGPESLETLRFVRSLGERATSVLGNHDLHLLACAYDVAKPRGKDTVGDVLSAPDSAELIEWLRRLPLVVHDARRELLLVHAGILPDWSFEDAVARSREVEAELSGDNPAWLLGQMYGDKPRRYKPGLESGPRLRVITNILTRLRYLDETGRLQLKFKGPPADAPAGLTPWFRATSQRPESGRIIFGHWSSLGTTDHGATICLDTGCLWGRCLTAMRIEESGGELISVDCEDLGLA